MTITVTVSLNVKVENGDGKNLQSNISTNRLEEDLKGLSQQITKVMGKMVLAGVEAKMKAGEYREGVSIHTEARRYQFQGFSIDYRRRSYRMPDGSVRSPLDELLGFEKYQRRSYKAKEQLCALGFQRQLLEDSPDQQLYQPGSACAWLTPPLSFRR